MNITKNIKKEHRITKNINRVLLYDQKLFDGNDDIIFLQFQHDFLILNNANTLRSASKEIFKITVIINKVQPVERDSFTLDTHYRAKISNL